MFDSCFHLVCTVINPPYRGMKSAAGSARPLAASSSILAFLALLASRTRILPDPSGLFAAERVSRAGGSSGV